jgi:hypothetical protein
MFAIHGSNLPRARSYAEAVKVYEEARQHPRFSDGWRGLKDMRDTSKCVRMERDTVVFRYHHTDLVKWSPKKIAFKLYDSQSSVIFTNRFVPDGMYARSLRGEMYLCHDGKYYSQRLADGVEFVHDGKWSVVQDTVSTFEAEVFDRKRAHQVRKVMAPFLDWWESMNRLGAPIRTERLLHLSDVLGSLRVSLDRGTVPEEHYRQLAASLTIKPDVLLRQAYVLGGAVRREPAPFGAPRPELKYAGLSAWKFI